MRKQYNYDSQRAAAYAAASAKAQADATRRIEEDARRTKINDAMEKLRGLGLEAKVTIRQVTESGILGDAEYIETGTYTDTVQVPGTALETVPRTAKVKRNYSQYVALGYIFVPGVGRGLADGEIWEGKLWPAGTYRYTAVTGGSKTVRRYAASAEQAIMLLHEPNQ
jgi:hypothetical protein